MKMNRKEGHAPLLIVIAGPNGSGKTTITSEVLKSEWMEDAVYINPDNVALEEFGDWNSPEAVRKAAMYCEEWRERCLANGESLIFETVMSTPGKLDFIRRAKAAGYFVRVFFVSTNNPAINAARIVGRVMKGGHDVPITKIISRYSKSITNCARISSEVDRMYVYDNSRENEKALPLFRLKDGVLAKKYVEVIPDWAKSILPVE
jgi:predicted ABC-type ATPase